MSKDFSQENEFELAQNPLPCPPSRTPLTSIPDPSQNAETRLDPKSTLDSNQLRRSFEKRADVAEYVTPRNGRRRSSSEPNSVQSTPARSISRFSGVGGLEACTGSRPPQHGGGRGGSISRSSRGFSPAPVSLPYEVPHFEFMEDFSFWRDHNVQVLIRIRPLSDMEKALQGSGRCLRQESAQTLIWLGHPETRFTFDHVACETISQEKLFKVAGLPIVENCMSGYNSCMFAYGQTGSGKTYTMMGDIYETDNKLSEDCGMTPRIFEYLFMRIREEEESRRDDRLKYNCKCSFLEIYNEQITDLLQPEATNLQLREDMKKGVHVENLKEYEVTNVKDVLKLLLQGAANRKIAATHMNSESSRSHSVFTCVVESRWEKDSMAHVRFGRLNLVDLAGSERQKSSGAEGERLKEAANINKSLSTLGLVIMTLVDVAHGKQRHVPYRDSRLTFLLQDSLGGNSKTTIIANISPSICSANETLSTLKFAQRAKLIRNNAKVNEDASGDVIILQQQIQQLKEQLNFLKHQTISRYLLHHLPSYEQAKMGDLQLDYGKDVVPSVPYRPSVASREPKHLESTLVGALRREKTAETTIRRLEAENEYLNHLVDQKDEDAQRTKMLLRFREEKIRRMEMLTEGLISGDENLIEENKALSEEIQLLQARLDKNPEQTRFAMENIRLIEQLRIFQDFYEQGERETLLAEVSELRDQLLEILEARSGQTIFPEIKDETKVEPARFSTVQERDLSNNIVKSSHVDSTLVELEDYRKSLAASLERNAILTKQVKDLHSQLKRYLDSKETNYNIQLTSDSMEEDGIASSGEVKEKLLQYTGETVYNLENLQPADAQKELIEALEAQQLHLIDELENLRQENGRYLDLLQNQKHAANLPVFKLQTHCESLCRCLENHESREQSDQIVDCGCNTKPALQENWERMQRDLEAARSLNCQYQYDRASLLSYQHETEQVCEEVEVETAKTILHLQEELATLHQQIDSKNEHDSSAKNHYRLLRVENQEIKDRICILIQENISLKNAIAARDSEISSLNKEWEKAVLDLTNFLVDGYQSLEDATEQIGSIVHSFSEKKAWVGEEVEKAVKVSIAKEQIILDLQSRIEDAQNLGLEMKLKLNALKTAALAMTEVQDLENNECSQDVFQLRMLLNEKMCTVKTLKNQIKIKEDQIIEAEKKAYAAFLTIKVLHEMMTGEDSNRTHNKDADQTLQVLEEIRMQLEMALKGILDSENVAYIDTEKLLSSTMPGILKIFADVQQMIQDLSNEIFSLRKKVKESKEENTKITCLKGTSQSLEVYGVSNPENQYASVQLLRSELANTNEKLDMLKMGIKGLLNLSNCSATSGDPAIVNTEAVGYGVCENMLSQSKYEACSNEVSPDDEMKHISKASSAYPFTSVFYLSLMNSCMKDEFDDSSSLLSDTGCSGVSIEQKQGLLRDKKLAFVPGHNNIQGFHCHLNNLTQSNVQMLSLREGVEHVLHSLLEIYIQLSMSFAGETNDSQAEVDYNEEYCHPVMLAVSQILQKFGQTKVEAEASCYKRGKMRPMLKDGLQFVEEKMKQANNLLLKFEEAQETIKEADLMLNVLLKVNENAKHKKIKWKQAAEELMIEKASLINEVQQLKASVQLKEERNDLLQDQIHAIPEDVAEALSSLETLSTDMFSSRKVLLDSITASRSWFEDTCAEVMEESFALFVEYHCHIGALSDKCQFLNNYFSRQTKHCSVRDGFGNDITSFNNEKVLKELSNSELHSLKDRNSIKTVHTAVVSIREVDSVNSGDLDLSAEVKHFIEEESKLEKDKSDVEHDMLLIDAAINRQLTCLKKLEEQLTALFVASHDTERILRNQNANAYDISREPFHSMGQLSSENASHSIMLKDNGFLFRKIETHKVGLLVNENEPMKAEIGRVASDEDDLLASIHHLRAWCVQIFAVLAETKEHTEMHFQNGKSLLTSSNDIGNGITVHGMKKETETVDWPEPRSEYGHHFIQALKKQEDKLTYLKDYVKSRMHKETRNVFNSFLIETLHQGICNIEEKAYKLLVRPVEEEAGQTDMMLENLSLKRELARKEFLLEGLSFDLRLLQESTSNVKDIKDETEEMVATLSQVQEDLACKSTLIDETLVRYKDLELQLADREAALSISESELGQVKETLDMLLNDNTELRLLLEDIYLEKNNAECQLEEKEKVVQVLEREILQMTSSVEERIHLSVAEIEDKLRRVTSERNQLQEQADSLKDKLEMSNALADENEAIAVEARQVAEASKIYAEQKEEEVRILEHSVEELEYTINVLEQKVDEMGEEVERHRATREDLELELQSLRTRMLNVENATENFDVESPSSKETVDCQISRKIDDRIMELIEAKRHIRALEKEKAQQENEIQQCKDYISELVLHSEAQASQYQQKYKTLEDMVCEAKANPSTMNIGASTMNKMEKSMTRSRGSGSPFKCIASLVQQMNSEKEKELKLAQLRIEELEALAAGQQKEVCMLNARLARTENMTHDVIRDLLGVKLDITNYANLIDQLQLQKLAETAQQQTEESNAKEQEIIQLRKQIDDFIMEKESWAEEINRKQADMLAVQVTVEQLQQRDQLLMAQNEMLKKEKANLMKKVGELDEMVKKLFGSQAIQRRVDHPMKTKEKSFVRIGNDELSRRLAHSEKLLSHVNDELAHYCNLSGKDQSRINRP